MSISKMNFFSRINRALPTDVKVGQVWTYSMNSDNPFEKTVINYQTVLDVKDGWIKYHIVNSNGLSYSSPSSCKVSNFKIGSKLFKDV